MGNVDIDLFKPELVFFDFEAADRFGFFKKMEAVLLEGGYIKDTWYAAITTREKNFPTGLQFETISVALPHVDPEHLIKPYIAVIRPKDPVVFEGMAGIGGDIPAELIVNLGLTEHAEGAGRGAPGAHGRLFGCGRSRRHPRPDHARRHGRHHAPPLRLKPPNTLGTGSKVLETTPLTPVPKILNTRRRSGTLTPGLRVPHHRGP